MWGIVFYISYREKIEKNLLLDNQLQICLNPDPKEYGRTTIRVQFLHGNKENNLSSG